MRPTEPGVPPARTPASGPSRARRWLKVAAGMLGLIAGLTILPVNRPMAIVGTPVPAGADSVVLAVGSRYRANAVQRWLQGQHYRELWTLPVHLEVLDLTRFDGGLLPVEEGGGMQTRNLHFESGNGHQWAFRSTDKEPTRSFYPLFRRGVIAWMLQDQTSSSMPAGALVVAPLERAAGLPSGHPRYVVLPDDSRLASFRSRFKGVAGILEERPRDRDDPAYPSRPDEIRDTEELIARLDSSSTDRVDEEEYLTARLLDFFLGDWDRHPGQWRWAARREPDLTRWRALPLDRDQAFSWYDGMVMALARVRSPKLGQFTAEIEPLRGLTRNSHALDQRMLAGLPRAAYDSIAGFLRGRLTDAAIDRAARQLPAPYWAESGVRLATVLKDRREQIGNLATELYSVLAGNPLVDVAKDATSAEITRDEQGSLLLQIRRAGSDTPVYQRRFLPFETRRIDLHLHGAGLRLIERGAPTGPISLRVRDSAGRTIPIKLLADTLRPGTH